ncbi:L-carnitine dehydrogenase [Pseudomonas paraeruginosa]|uniref:L-carnitine dehydrogenase n=1 Tax=Pseudomonas paraeruginosa TaxID=2994495 RepID=UPI0006CC1E19|nr:L-carnitine dehydrogenase [Pseudomonas paraeruginosa]KPD25378.1 3-hydroxybutyryl-CoA dehydrogenase [Pseudomonas paraeruginosa]
MSFVTEIKTFAALGSGVIGSGWIARALAHGLDVVAWDPAPGAEAALRARVANAWPALRKQGLAPGAAQERLRFVASIEECVGDADFVQESAPERLDLKLDLHARISAAARPDVLIGSSTSGLLPSEFYAEASHPERCLVGHPFNPVYLLPLVEVVGGERTAAEAVRAAMRVYESLGMRPLHVRKEVPGFIADRLLEALWREALHLVNDGVATTGEIDDAIRFGAGLRWSFMGTFLTYTLAGGNAGMRHFMAQFGPALQLPWTYLPAPEHETPVLPEWVDYNGHLRDAFYLLVFSYATDALMAHIGLDSQNREASGHSLFTLECHLNFLHEVKEGARVEVRTQLLGHDRKRLHVHHALYLPGSGQALALSEQMLLHVSLDGPRSVPFEGEVLARVEALAEAHRALPVPEGVGRVIGLPPVR